MVSNVRRRIALLLAAVAATAAACAAPLQARLPAVTAPAPSPSDAWAPTPSQSATGQEPPTAPVASPAPAQTTPPPPVSTLPAGYDAWSATALTVLSAYAAPDPASATVATFRVRNEYGDPQTFRVLAEARGPRGGIWYQVLLPIQPNGSTGWVRMRDVSVKGQEQHLVVDLSQRTLVRLVRGTEVGRWRVAIGRADTPTPAGPSYLWTVWTPEDGNDDDEYGAGVLGMSAMSPTLSDWKGGTPRIAIHGTPKPTDIGRSVSHGCVRMLNTELRPLLREIPLGTPIDVVA